MENKICFVIVGPTAVGKTNFALQLARHLNTQIISADSRQCYKELNIGVAKPSLRDLQQVKHYFINSHSIYDNVNAKRFEQYALQSIDDIFKEHTGAVMVGGTGLYVKAFCEGIDHIPPVNAEIKNTIVTNYNNGGLEWLKEQVQKNDPIYFSNGEIKNPQRMIRALEVKLSTGRSITEFHSFKKKKRPFKIIKIGLELPKVLLHQNINNRVDAMMQAGLSDEVKSLLPYKNFTALNTVGYRELFAYLDGERSYDESVALIKLNTRHYAKRQLTWFKKDKEISWIDAQIDEASFINICKEATSSLS